MKTKRKFQVFISSTYKDLIPERQAAVEAILRAGHIPAGMELFSAGNESQEEVIKRWIDESDVYMLILGGRYGTIKPKSKKSYIEIEYKHALKRGIPCFAVVLSDEALDERVKSSGRDVLELDHAEELKKFRKFVLKKTSRFFTDHKDIKIAVMEALLDISQRYDLAGWVPATEIPDFQSILKESAELRQKIRELELENQNLRDKKKPALFGQYTFTELGEMMRAEKIKVPEEYTTLDSPLETDLLKIFVKMENVFNMGIDNSLKSSEFFQYLFYNVAPLLLSFGLVEKVKVAGVQWRRIETSAVGLRFFAEHRKRLYAKKKRTPASSRKK